MPAPYRTLSYNVGGVLSYLGRTTPPPTQDQKDCLKDVLSKMKDGRIVLIPGKPGFFLPVCECEHLITAYELSSDRLHISNLRKFVPGPP